MKKIPLLLLISLLVSTTLFQSCNDDDDDYYVYDEAHLMLIGERTKNIYRLGDAVKVRCSRVDIDNREIFFDIVKNEGEKEEIVPSKRTASIIAEIKKEFGPKEEGQKEEDEGM